MIGRCIDQGVYPDMDEPPTSLDTAEARADYVDRICEARDHGVHPDPATLAIFEGWEDVFDLHPVLTSPAYQRMI